MPKILGSLEHRQRRGRGADHRCRHVVVADDDADPKVARVVSLDADGNIELEVLSSSVESHADLLTSA